MNSAEQPAIPALPATPLPLSAKGPEALREQAERLVSHLGEHPDLDPVDVAFSLATSRAKLEHRATAIGSDREELLEALGALATGKPHPNLIQGRAAQGRLAFLFSGQGAQRPGMGKELYESFPAFAKALDEICAELDPLLDRSLKDLLFAEEGSDESALLDATSSPNPPSSPSRSPSSACCRPGTSPPTTCSATRSGSSAPLTSPGSSIFLTPAS